MKIGNLWKFSLSALALTAASSARPIGRIGSNNALPHFTSTPIPEFQDNYTLPYMLNVAMENHGNVQIGASELRPKLFDEKGFLSSENLWNAWKAYEPVSVYYALKNSTNGHTERTCGGNPLETLLEPDLGLAAMITTSYMALVDQNGKYVQFKDGEVPNWELRKVGPNNSPGGLTDTPQALKDRGINSKFGAFCAYGRADNPEEFGNIVYHELFHTLSQAMVVPPELGTTFYEQHTEFLATRWTQNTTNAPAYEGGPANPPGSLVEQGQYLFTAIASVLSDPCRNLETAKDVRFVASDFPPVLEDGSSSPVPEGTLDEGVEKARELYTVGNKHIEQIVLKLAGIYSKGEHLDSRPIDCSQDLPLKTKLAIGLGVTALMAAGAAAYFVLRDRARRNAANVAATAGPVTAIVDTEQPGGLITNGNNNAGDENNNAVDAGLFTVTPTSTNITLKDADIETYVNEIWNEAEKILSGGVGPSTSPPLTTISTELNVANDISAKVIENDKIERHFRGPKGELKVKSVKELHVDIFGQMNELDKEAFAAALTTLMGKLSAEQQLLYKQAAQKAKVDSSAVIGVGGPQAIQIDPFFVDSKKRSYHAIQTKIAVFTSSEREKLQSKTRMSKDKDSLSLPGEYSNTQSEKPRLRR